MTAPSVDPASDPFTLEVMAGHRLPGIHERRRDFADKDARRMGIR